MHPKLTSDLDEHHQLQHQTLMQLKSCTYCSLQWIQVPWLCALWMLVEQQKWHISGLKKLQLQKPLDWQLK